jgi:alpha-L-fucosidase
MKKLLPLLVLSVSHLYAQKKVSDAHQNFVEITSSDTPADIIRKAAHVTPSPRQLRWQQLELTAFLHFGINTFTDHEWGNGKEDISVFNPVHLDADQWIKTLKDAGFKQAIITAKHHDGFCLWPSKYTEHSIKNTPWKNGKGDVVKEVADACHKYHMGFGVYLSPWDRNSSLYGDSALYNTYFMNQLTELLTQYGKVDEVWFDGANGEGSNGKKQVYDFNRWYQLIRKLQPSATIAVMGPDVRWVGTESGEGRTTEWSVVPADARMQQAIAEHSQKELNFAPNGNMMGDDLGSRSKILKAKGLVWYPAETDVSIRPGWFYHEAEDKKVKSPERLVEIYFSSVGRNSQLLLNIPPDKEGLISESDINNLKGFSTLLKNTFTMNLLKDAHVTCVNGICNKCLTDGKISNYWTTKGNDTTAIIEYQLPEEKTFDVLCLQEDISQGQRIEKFVLEYKDGESWKEIVEGTTVGYKRLLRFSPVRAATIRLRIESSRTNPTLSEMGLYKLADLK